MCGLDPPTVCPTEAQNCLTGHASFGFDPARYDPYAHRIIAFDRIKMVAKMKDDPVGDGSFSRMRVSSLRSDTPMQRHCCHTLRRQEAKQKQNGIVITVSCSHMFAQAAHLSVLQLVTFDCTKSRSTMLELVVSAHLPRTRPPRNSQELAATHLARTHTMGPQVNFDHAGPAS